MKLKTGIFFLIFLFLVTSVSFASSKDVATLEEINGEVFVLRSAGKVEYRAKDGMNLYQGDSIRTGKNSSVKINFGDDDVTTLGENGKITIARLSSTMEETVAKDLRILATSQGKNVAVKQESGKTWTKVKNLVGSGKRHKVETSTAVMGVRGTLFLTEVNANGQTVLTVLDGQVGVDTDRSSLQQDEGAVNPGQMYRSKDTSFQSEPVNFRDLFSQIQPELGREIIEDTIAKAEDAVQEAEQMMEAFLQNQGDEQLGLDSLQLIAHAELLATIVDKMVQGAKQSSMSATFEQQLTEITQRANQINERTQALTQQVEKMVEQSNLPVSVKQQIEEKSKLIDEVIKANPNPTTGNNPISETQDDDSGTTPPPSTGGGTTNPGGGTTDPGGGTTDPGGGTTDPGGGTTDPGGGTTPNGSFAPWYTGENIYIWDLGRNEVIQARETQKYKDLSGGVWVSIFYEDFIENSGYDFEYFTIRGSTDHQFYTMDRLQLRGTDPIFHKNDPIFYDVANDEKTYILPLQPEQSNLNWFTVIFYDQNDKPLGYFTKKIDSIYFYYPDKVGAAGNGYHISNLSNGYRLTLYWTEPFNNDNVTYTINDNRINASCQWGTCQYSINNIALEEGQREIYRVAAVFDDGTASEELEIVVPLDYPKCAECDDFYNKLENGELSWDGDEEFGYSSFTYFFHDPFNFRLFTVASDDTVIFDSLNSIVFYDSDDIKIGEIDKFDYDDYEYYFVKEYFLNLSDVKKIVGNFNPLIHEKLPLHDMLWAKFDAVEPLPNLRVLKVTDVQSHQVTIELDEKFYANLNELKIYVNGIEYSHVATGNSFIIGDLEPNQTYLIYFDMQIMRYDGDFNYSLVDRVSITTSSE